jgi:hypothetical protein
MEFRNHVRQVDESWHTNTFTRLKQDSIKTQKKLRQYSLKTSNDSHDIPMVACTGIAGQNGRAV